MHLSNKFLEVQDELNKKLHPEWEKQGWAYPDAMFTEATEAYNHLNWEWWRSTNRMIDWSQVNLEWIDVAHFMFSEIIVQGTSAEFMYLCKIYEEASKTEGIKSENQIDVPELKKSIKRFITSVLEYDYWKQEDWVVARESLHLLIAEFLSVLAELDLTLEEFYSLFIGKVCLNQLRWKNGYKKGVLDQSSALSTLIDDNRIKYVKIWDGQEDNVWLSNFAATLDPNDPDYKSKIEQALDIKYKEVYDAIWNTSDESQRLQKQMA